LQTQFLIFMYSNKNKMAAVPMLAGVGLLVVCSSVSAAMMMGGEEKEDPVVPKTPVKTADAAQAAADAVAADPDATPEEIAAAQAAADAVAADPGAAASAVTDTCVETCAITTTSADGKYRLEMQSDGNLVIYDGGDAVWASNTNGKGVAPYTLAMQGDGNLVIYDKDYSATWASNTAGKGEGPYTLIMQGDRNLVIYGKDYSVIWASNTGV
jgi:hypothetical protein